MDLQERLKQCRKDKAAIEEQERKLMEQIEQEEKIKFGDIVVYRGYSDETRIVLYDNTGKLRAFNCDGHICGIPNVGRDYKSTEKTIWDLFKTLNN